MKQDTISTDAQNETIREQLFMTQPMRGKLLMKQFHKLTHTHTRMHAHLHTHIHTLNTDAQQYYNRTSTTCNLLKQTIPED